VFQFESRGMQGMLRDAKPSRLEDLIALNALYRPGPMDLIPSFVARKHGRGGGVPAPAGGAGAGRDLRHHGLPGAGDADRPGAGRLLAGRRRLLRRAMGKKKSRRWPSTAASSARAARRASARTRPTRSST
jgi:DNA polymerase-3 subunit alpha